MTFEKNLENGLKVLKRYRFHSEDDVIDIDVEVQNPTVERGDASRWDLNG